MFNNDASCSFPTVGVYSIDSGELLFLVKGHSGGITHLVFSANGNYLYSGGRKVRDYNGSAGCLYCFVVGS